MKFASLGFRSKLTLTAVVVITLLYLLLGFALKVAAQSAILNSVDHTLNTMAAGMAEATNHPGRPPRFDGPRDFDHDDGPDLDDMGLGFEGPSNPPPRPEEQEAKAEAPNFKETRPQLVWREHRDIHIPFPLVKPTDVDATLQAKKGLGPFLETVDYEGQPVRVITLALRDPRDHHVEGVGEINYWMGDIDKTLNSLTNTLLIILPIGILVMGAASTFVVGKTLRPIREMTTAAAKIGAEDLSGRLEVVADDEFSRLAATMNGMFGRLQVSFEAQKEALEQLKEVLLQQRRFTADASHELKTPLAVVKVNASLLKSSLAADPDGIESVEAIDLAVNRMSKLVQDLLLLARTDSGQLAEQFGEVDLISTADQAASSVPCAKRIDLFAPSEALLVTGSQFAIERLLTNLLDNACRHSEPDTRVELRLSGDREFARVQVIDHGEGIPPEHLPKIFGRFHRVDGSRHSGTGGAGLGLAISKGIVEAHGGKITVESRLGQGTVFTICLPLIRSAQNDIGHPA